MNILQKISAFNSFLHKNPEWILIIAIILTNLAFVAVSISLFLRFKQS
ncbi:hypothetical protein PSOLA_00540 [Candidatus Phytoplasma solani]